MTSQNKNIFKKKRGVTLTELIVASVMIGIVMVGVASFGSTIRRLQSSTNRSVILAMKAKSAMARISDDAFATVGDNNNLGYDFLSPGGNDRSICFRHDINITPEIYADDSWVCYYRDAADALFLCGPNPTVPPNTDGECDGSGARKKLIDLTQTDFFNIVETLDASATNDRLDYFDLYIFSRFDPATAMDPITNPDYNISTQISPPGQSR